ncbi:DsrE family protein [Candidatus Latescibacterota bacterium]
MKRLITIIPVLIIAAIFSVTLFSFIEGTATAAEQENIDQSRLLVVWTSGDREVALKMVFMYTYNAKLRGWWDEVQLLVWGPSSKLLSSDKELQEHIERMKETGIILTACKACADQYDVSDTLSGLGIDVKYMGEPLTDMLKEGWTTITF